MKTTLLLTLTFFGLFSSYSKAQCLIDDFGEFPGGIYVPSVCDGATENIIADNCWTGEYTVVALLAGNSYTFSSSIPTDYVTISDGDGTTAVVFAVGSVSYTPTISDNYRFYLHNNAACDSDQNDRSRILVCTGTIGCVTGTLYPAATFMPTVCDGGTENPIATDCFAGQYSNVNLIGNTLYAFTCSNVTDYITITDAAGIQVLTSGFEFVAYNPVLNETIRFYTHTNIGCGTENINRTRSVLCLGSGTGLAGPCSFGAAYPEDPFTPTCTGSPEAIAADCWSGEHSIVALLANTTYEFSSSNTSDWLTITNEAGTTVLDYGFGPISYTSGPSASPIRFYSHTDSLCGFDDLDRERRVQCEASTSGLDDLTAVNFKLFPNPASDKISIQSVLTFDEIEVLSIDGRVLTKMIPSSTTTEIDVEKLAKGTYFICAKTNGEFVTKEFIKN